MAHHGPAYGLSRECQLKAQAKYDAKRAREALHWVNSILGDTRTTLEEAEVNVAQFHKELKDGQALCRVINAIYPGSVGKINTMSASFKERENIEKFIKACESYGMKSQDLFQVNDLYEQKNVYMIVDCLHSLGGLAQKNNAPVPTLGVRVAEKCERQFSEEVLKQGSSVIGLQYGSNRGASQAGMSSYGAKRQILP